MLAGVARPKFVALQDVAKQLFVWAFNARQGFHCTCNNGYYEGRRQNFRPKRQRWESFDLEKKVYNLDSLEEFKKDFYTPHPDVQNRSKEEIEKFYSQNEISTFGNLESNCPSPIFTFEELNLSSDTMNVINKLNYNKPTPIQSVTWPIALSGYNMVGVAQTGSGKTLGFVLPGMIHVKNQSNVRSNRQGPVALVISPTRELAQQTESVLYPFARSFGFNSAVVFGGASKSLQFSRLRNAEVCVGTPGRMLDFLKETSINLERCTYFVLDEADRLLDMGFEPQIRSIMSQMRPDSQILMWSATWPKEVRNLASEFLKNYIGVKFGSSELTVNKNITQRIIVCRNEEKLDLLFKLLDEITGDERSKTLIFCQTIRQVELLSRALRSQRYRTKVIHGQMTQNARDYALSDFRSGRAQVLLGTAVVARGLDVSDIMHVINFDFPNTVEDYVHVVGRTGRMDNKGTSHTFFTDDDARHAKDLIKLLKESNQEVPEKLLEFTNSRYRNDFGESNYRSYGNRNYRNYRHSGW